MKTTAWYDALHQCQHQGKSYVLITVLSAAGSTPRESGSKMLVTGDSQYDTIGGGHLEYVTIQKAREMLVKSEQTQVVESFPLSSKLGQCCGGAMKVLFEVRVSHGQHITIFGTGHVAQALVPILAQLPLQIHWVDDRKSLFDPALVPKNVEYSVEEDPIAVMNNQNEGAWAVILTHNHQLDYELVECALKHQRLSFLGMIGSDTKAKRFRTRLESRGYSEQQIAHMVSPIGERSIVGKRPIEVAVSISAQLINQLNSSVDNVNSVMDKHYIEQTITAPNSSNTKENQAQ